jgi:hypothetical protein
MNFMISYLFLISYLTPVANDAHLGFRAE